VEEAGERERPVMVWPAERSSAMRTLPMKPVAPVMKTCILEMGGKRKRGLTEVQWEQYRRNTVYVRNIQLHSG
jgi:hypothetical protein